MHRELVFKGTNYKKKGRVTREEGLAPQPKGHPQIVKQPAGKGNE
jgi:hypothetical protein